MSFIEVRVVETRGSTPRGPGTRMWVGAGETRGFGDRAMQPLVQHGLPPTIM